MAREAKFAFETRTLCVFANHAVAWSYSFNGIANLHHCAGVFMSYDVAVGHRHSSMKYMNIRSADADGIYPDLYICWICDLRNGFIHRFEVNTVVREFFYSNHYIVRF